MRLNTPLTIALLLITAIILEEAIPVASAEHPQPPSGEKQETPPEWKYTLRLGTNPFYKILYHSPPRPLVDLIKAVHAAASYALPQALTPRQQAVVEERRTGIQAFQGPGEGDPPPMVWSRLNVTSSAYVYDTAWGRYVFPKNLPTSVFFHSLMDDGFCEEPNPEPEPEKPCLRWHSNYSYNATAYIWLTLGGVPMAPVSFSVLNATDGIFQAYAVGTRLTSTYYLKVTVDFTQKRPTPKLTLEAGRVSGSSTNFRIVLLAATPQGSYMDLAGASAAVSNYAGTQALLGNLAKVRIGMTNDPPSAWRRYFLFDSSDFGQAETWVGSFTILGRSFTGIMIRYPVNTPVIDPGFYVFASGVVNVDISSTGEKTIATFNTTIPAGNNLLIIMMEHGANSYTGGAAFNLVLYRGTTLVESGYTYSSGQAGQEGEAKIHHMLARDANAPDNPSYTVKLNVITAVSGATLPVRVLMMVINGVDMAYRKAFTVSVASGATADVNSLSTTLPAGKYVVLAAWAYRQSTLASYALNAGNVRIKAGTTILASNQYAFYHRWTVNANAAMLVAPYTATNNQVYSLEVVNNTGLTLTFDSFLAAFKVADSAFLDTASVALGTTENTVANLTTTLSGDVGVISILSVASTTSSTRVSVSAGNAKLQNSVTGQQTNSIYFVVEAYTNLNNVVASVLLQVFTNVANPSFQVKVTTNTSNSAGEVKMLAFTLAAGQSFSYQLSETVSASDTVLKALVFIRSETVSASDSLSRLVMFLRQMGETTTLSDSLSRLRLVPRDVSDTAAASDIVVRLGVFTRPITESAAASDSLAAFRIFIRAVSEAVSGSDSLSRLVMFLRQMSETTTLSDTLTKMKGFLITVTEAVAASDSFMRAVAFLRHVEEPISLGESLTKPLTSVSLLQTLVAADLLAVVAPSGSGGGVSPPPQAGPQTGVSLPGGDAGLLITLLTVAGGGLAVAAGRRRRKSMGEVWRSVMRPVRMKKPVKIRRLKLRKPVINLRRHRDRMGE